MSHGKLRQLRTAIICCLLAAATAGGRSQAPSTAREVTVINDGVPGENSEDLRARFAVELRKWQPDYVVLYTGMNDAANDKKFVATERFKDNVQLLLGEAESARASVVLVAIQPVDERRVMQRHSPASFGGRLPNQRIVELNEVLATIAQQRHVPLVRFDEVLRQVGGPTELLSTDGIHLNATGYGLLASAVRAALPKAWPAGKVILCIGDSLTFGQGVRPAGTGTADGEHRAYPTYPEQLKGMLAASATVIPR